VSGGQMRLVRLAFAEAGEPLRAFWQASFYDFNVYSKGKKTEKLNYMHANPVIRGLVNIRGIGVGAVWGFITQERRGSWLWTWESEKTETTLRPRFTNRTWGTLRVGLS
jgi:hypothetical protein